MCKFHELACPPSLEPLLFRRLERDWKKATAMAEFLLRENNWSKATSCYLLATFQFEANNHVSTDEILQLYR